MGVSKIAATLSLIGALSLARYGPAQSAPLTSLSAAAKPGAHLGAVQVRFGGWDSPLYYGGYYPNTGYGYPYTSGYPAYGYGYYHYDGGYQPYADYDYDATRYPAYRYGYHRPYWRRYGYGLDRPYYRRWY